MEMEKLYCREIVEFDSSMKRKMIERVTFYST